MAERQGSLQMNEVADKAAEHLPADFADLADEMAAAIEECYARGWSDGLPVVPPTEDRVRAMVDRAALPGDHVLGEVAPARRPIRVRELALQAVLAGCEPSAMPVLVAAMQALLSPSFNLHGVATSTAGAAPLLVLNGPAAAHAGINSGADLFGPGIRANVTIGRTVSLVLRNIGGAVPGQLSQAALSHSGRYSYCIAENEADSPWEPFHVDRGFAADASVVTAIAAMSVEPVGNNPGRTPEEILWTVADTMCTLGASNLSGQGEIVALLGVAHAVTIAQAGWSRADVKRNLWLQARRTVGDMKRVQRLAPTKRLSVALPGADPEVLVEGVAAELPDDAAVPMTVDPDAILLMVAGGTAGRMSVAIPTWLNYQATRAVSVALV